MIFPVLSHESIVQVDDKTRLDASKSFSNSADITLVEIDPDGTGTFYDITNVDGWYLDMVYGVEGDKTITLRINTTTTKTFTINIVSEDDDNLFSNDGDIIGLESDILKYLPDGRSSFLDKHREAQKEILNDLDASGVWKRNGERYEALDIIDIQEFKDWSKYVTLRIIFEGLSNEVGDIFRVKADNYASFQSKAMKRAVLRLSPDGVADTQKVHVFSGNIERAG